MKFTSALFLSSVIYAVAATRNSNGCNQNNCYRAVKADNFPTRPGTADCSSFLSTTVEQKTSTEINEGVKTIVTYYETTIPTHIPAYASPCSDSPAKYSSACSCIGVTPVTTVIIPTCGPGTLSCNNGPCQDVLSDPYNCGACGNTCESGTCINGQCSVPSCDGSSCGSLNGCGADCFCFKEASGKGFCGPNVSCAPLKDCNANSDCDIGEVCAISTCCSRNVCLNSCALTRRSLASNFVGSRDVNAGWTGGAPPPALF
ncbi:hypothetical protein AOL_s00169g141 [Orbilia oligospora ATCC 24927]|uniref:Uncharacterized protein n=2 Tax=Orbilia oligospora TaxID=2813651 RepID=G1XMT8_ARTOA|nr:hypothetical protein AOL_s00169g141 [Orbilia oligospora ATCC 24927]EGX45535.1 hypothetical protein AOL_s00169g141 [Orbilia oligospora ATCC 24927]KAF3283253.1 hypothetical protein TWF970_001232 [Orbilia oligospora]